MKKFFFMLLCAAMLPTMAWAEGGETADGLSWDLTDGVLTISGTGEMSDYASSTFGGGVLSPWRNSRTTITKIVVEEGITVIGAYAFYGSTACQTVELPSTLTELKGNALLNCSTLVSLTCLAESVPRCNTGASSATFKGVNVGTCKLYVPAASMAAYQADAAWSPFVNVEGVSAGSPKEPTISSLLAESNGYYAFVDDELTYTLTVQGADLTQDVTLSCANPNAQFSTTLLSKEDVMSAEGAAFTVSILATEGNGKITVMAQSGDAKRGLDLNWTAYATQNYSNIAALKAAFATATGEEYLKLTGSAVVTYVTSAAYSDLVYLQDEDAAFCLNTEAVGMYEAGDLLQNIVMYYYGGEAWAATNPMPVSTENAVNPVAVTLAELNANPAAYKDMFVAAQNVEFDLTESQFDLKPMDIKQGAVAGKFRPSADLKDAVKPALANVQGIWVVSMGTYYIQARCAADVEGVPSAIDNAVVNAKAQKLVRDGQMLILKEGRSYNMLGHESK